jgi:hypothetical protein
MNRKKLLDDERDNKIKLFESLCNQQYQGLNKEPLTGSEIVKVWQKLLKSRGLYMKQNILDIELKQMIAELNRDDSHSQNTTISENIENFASTTT